MTVSEAISFTDAVKPNAFTQAEKIRWLNSLEGRVAADVFLLSPADIAQLTLTSSSTSWELLVKPPHDDIYVAWLKAQIDLNNGEYSKYQNTMQEFNALYNNFVAWFASLYEPARGYLYPVITEGGS